MSQGICATWEQIIPQKDMLGRPVRVRAGILNKLLVPSLLLIALFKLQFLDSYCI